MKWIIFTVLAVFVLTVQSISAMSYERASAEARFLTDKMAYELNLDDYQYQQAYDINFNYFYNLNDASDFYGNYWRTRNRALEVIFNTLQFRIFCRLDYFYRPIYVYHNVWTFPIYRRYPRTRYFRPAPPRPPRLRPSHGFHYDPMGRPMQPRQNKGHLNGNRPDHFFNDRHDRPDNRSNKNAFLPRGREYNSFRPSNRGNSRESTPSTQMKRTNNTGSFGKIRRM